MVYSIKVEQLIHVAVDAENGLINQHLLIKLLEFIVRRSNIHTLNVVLDENEKIGAECCKYIKSSKMNKILSVDEISEEIKSKEISEDLTLDPVVCNAFEYPNLNKYQEEWTTPTNQPVKTALTEEVATSTTDFLDDSSLDCNSVESFDESPESIYKLPSEETISESELLKGKVDEMPAPSTLSLDKFLEEKHEYHLHTNDIHVIADIIDQLHGKIKKINNVINVLQKSIKKCNIEDSDSYSDSEIDVYKQIAFSDMGSAMEVEKHGYDRSKLDENLKSLDLSSKGEVFKTVFGRFQKIKDLNLPLSVGNFREFDLEYRTNFQTIHSFIELYEKSFNKIKSDIIQIQKSNLDKDDFFKFKTAISSSHAKMKTDIKEYILKDPEAMGIVRFVKDGSCMACGKSSMMKTTNTAPIYVEKDVPTRGSSRKSLQTKRRKTSTPPREKLPTESIINVPTGNINKLPRCSPNIDNWATKLKRFEKYHEREPIKQNAIRTYRLMYKEPKKAWK